MQLRSRVLMLEKRLDGIAAFHEEEPMPRVAGKPRLVAVEDIAAWCSRRLAKHELTDDERKSLRSQIEKLNESARRLRQDYMVNRQGREPASLSEAINDL